MHLKTILFIKNAFIVRGIISYLQQLLPQHNIEVHEKIIYTIEAYRPVLIIDRTIISEQPEFTLGRLRKNYSHCRIILISMKIPTDLLMPYLDEYILFTDSEQVVSEKIQKVYTGISDSVHSEGLNSFISDRELEVLRLVALGLTNKEIGDELCISTHTVITHRKNITAKLGIKTIAGLAVYAVLNGIISAEEMDQKNRENG
jgi:DNA-binding CsgD family transcriptional regulator